MTSRSLAALALLVLLAAGCGSSAAETGSDDSTRRDAAVKFAACMRDNGVRDFPDPDESGELTIDGVLNGSSLDPDSPAWKSATAACRDLQPAGYTGGRRNAEQQQASLAFARCMRENGVKDFPDPVNGEPLIDTNKIPSSAASGGMTILNAAAQRCHDFAAAAMTGR